MGKLYLVKNLFYTLILSAAIFSQQAYANPSSAKLKFDYDIDGSIYVDVKFDAPTTSRCIARHRSSLYYEGQNFGDSGVIRRSTHSRALNKGRKSTSLRAFNLPGVEQKDGKDPIIAVQVRLVCSGEDEITSNIEARYVKCGADAPRVSLQKYLNLIKKKFSTSK